MNILNYAFVPPYNPIRIIEYEIMGGDEALTRVPQYDQGKTVTFICHECRVPVEDLASRSFGKSVTLSLTHRIGMTPVESPKAVIVTDLDDPQKSGVSVVQIIKESHIAIHTWPETAGARVVVDSCKEFDTGKVLGLLVDRLNPKRIDVLPTVRGAIFRYE